MKQRTKSMDEALFSLSVKDIAAKKTPRDGKVSNFNDQRQPTGNTARDKFEDS